jgi:hypothetical protein
VCILDSSVSSSKANAGLLFLLPLKFFFQTIKNNPEKSWAGLVGIWIILSSMIF